MQSADLFLDASARLCIVRSRGVDRCKATGLRFQRDPAGVEIRHWTGVENLVWGSDFPHQESEYPNSLKVIEENFRNVPADETYKMTCGNVIDFFHLEDLVANPQREGATIA